MKSIQDIIKKVGPWYQCIYLPKYDLYTTDNNNAFNDNAYDNCIDNITLEEATIKRPIPKWNKIKNIITPEIIKGKTILEVGSNCGFFSFEFAKYGASHITGIDVADHHLKCANWCNKELGFEDIIQFLKCDFMLFDKNNFSQPKGLLSIDDVYLNLPKNQYDIVFSSTVLDHTFFPLLFIYKCLKIAKEIVFLDIPIINNSFNIDKNKFIITLGMSNDFEKYPHHAYNFSKECMIKIIERFGIPKEDIDTYPYGNNCLFIIKTKNMKKELVGA